MEKNYHAYTAEGANYPAYISVNQNVIGQIAVTVKSQGNETPSTIYLTPEQAEHLAADIIANINEGA